jgi:hypothetical protein
MKRIATITTTVLLAISANAHAMVDIGARVGHELGCGQSEKPVVMYMAYKRDQGTTLETVAATVASLQDGERQIALSRIEDVYLDPALAADTIAAYRVERCLRGFLLRNYAPYRERVRERLLYCQSLSMPGAKPFRRCLDELLHSLEDSVNTLAEQP